MRLSRRNDDDVVNEGTGPRPVGEAAASPRAGRPVDSDELRRWRAGTGERMPDREETVEVRKERWDVASLLAMAVGVALVVIGAVALVRAEVDSSWYSPVVEVAGASHTALLGAIELGVGLLLVLAGLAHARIFAAFVALVAGVGAALVALEPDLADRELALDRSWATALAVVLIVLALLLVMAPGRRVERVEHRPVTT